MAPRLETVSAARQSRVSPEPALRQEGMSLIRMRETSPQERAIRLNRATVILLPRKRRQIEQHLTRDHPVAVEDVEIHTETVQGVAHGVAHHEGGDASAVAVLCLIELDVEARLGRVRGAAEPQGDRVRDD